MSVLQRLLGPTTQQQRQQELLTAERNANLQAQDAKFFDELIVDGLMDRDGNVDFKKLVEKDSTGYKYENQIVKLLNQSNKFKQFTDTQEGMDKLGVIEGFRDNEDGTKTIITRRPDTKVLAPKTWFASDDPNDLVANLTNTQFEDLISGMAALVRKRANPNLGQGVIAQSVQRDGPTDLVTGQPMGQEDDPIAEAGEVLDEIDNAEGVNLQEANEVMLGIITDLGTRLRQIKEQKPEVDTEGLSLPIATANVTTPAAQKGAEFLDSITSESVLADSDLDLIVNNLSPYKRNQWKTNWKRAQVQYDRNETKQQKAIKDREGKLYRVGDARNDERYEKEKQRLLNEKQQLIDQVKENIKTDSAAIAEAQASEEQRKTDRLSNLEQQLQNPNLSEARKAEIQAELDKAKTPAKDTSTSFTLNGELKDGATKEEVQSFFDNNKETIEAISKDGDLINRFREVITKYGVESEEDLNKIPFGTAEARNVTYQDAAIVLAAYDKQQNFADALYKYMGVYDRKMSMDKTALETDILYNDYLRDQRKYRQELTQEFLDAEADLIPLLFDDKGNYQSFTPETRAKVSNLMNQVKNLPGAPKFVVKNGVYEIQTEGEFAKDSLKGIAGLLFTQAVEDEGSVDFKDWFQGLFSPGDPKNIGNLIDNVRFRRVNPGDPNSPIAEIYFTPAGSNREAQGSLKPGDFTYRFGGPNENAFARNLILYYIQEYGIEES